jgi:16S rRNA (uracil1498-N3)-methyltransferase
MTRRRWIADEVFGNRAALRGEHADHLARVLRARVGQEFDISAGSVVRRGRIVSIAQGRVEFELGDEIPAVPPCGLGLLLAIFKFDRMEWAIEKCTELGVSRIIPVIARRTDARLAGASSKRTDRWRRIALQAAEQSRRPAPPEISDTLQLKDALGLSADTRIVLAESEQECQLRDLLSAPFSNRDVLLAIGPEGGWTEDELRWFHDSGWLAASLGPTVLRAETAAIAATAIAISALS